MVELKSTKFIELEKCSGKFLHSDEKAYIFPLLVDWAGSDVEAAHWFQSEEITALGGKTGLEVCRSNNSADFVRYIQHIEREGFA